MASFIYLWKNRARFSIGSTSFFRAWAKRMLLTKDLFKRNSRRRKLTKRGAKIHDTAEIGEVRADGNKHHLCIGQNTFVGKVELALHDKIIIGNNVCINDGSKLLTGSHDIRDPRWQHIKKPIVIMDYAWIATNSIILPGVVIGKGAVVGAGSVVSKSVPDYTVVAGNPAKTVSTRLCSDLNYNPCEFLAVNQAWLKG